jgi:hypothetical protein
MTVFDIWEMSLDGNSQFLIHMNFPRHHFCCFHSCFFVCFGKVYGLRIGVYNTLASKICVKLLKPPEIQIPTPNTSFSDLLTHSRFHSMLFALPGYQFLYIVMNRCLYLTYCDLSGFLYEFEVYSIDSSKTMGKSPGVLSFIRIYEVLNSTGSSVTGGRFSRFFIGSEAKHLH